MLDIFSVQNPDYFVIKASSKDDAIAKFRAAKSRYDAAPNSLPAAIRLKEALDMLQREGVSESEALSNP